MARRRWFGAVAATAVVAAVHSPVPAHAAGGFAAVYGAGNPLHALGAYNPSTYVGVDVDADGDLDIAVRDYASDAGVDVFRNDGGTFTALVGAANPFSGVSFAAHPANFVNTRVLTGDFDGDGDVDVWHHGVGFTALYRNDGATFSTHSGSGDPLAALAAHDPGTYVVVDADTDGDPDVIAREPTADASVELFRNDGGTFTRTTAAVAAITFPGNPANFASTRVLVLDADHDGDADLWHHGVGAGALYRNDGGTFSVHAGGADPLQQLASYDQGSYTTADVDSDGDADVVVREPSTDLAVDVLRNDGGSFTALTGPASPFAAISLATTDFERIYMLSGDLDGDGDADVYNQALNELYRQSGGAPRVLARTPARGAVDHPVTAPLQLAFDEPVARGDGAVTVRRADGTTIERIDVDADAARISGAGTSTVTIDPLAALPFATHVSVAVDPGAFVSAGDGDAFAGSGPVTWRFVTAADTAPAIGALDGDVVHHTAGETPVPIDAGADATVIDADGIGFAGGTLTATIAGGSASDALGPGAPAIGAVTPSIGGFSVALSGGADATAVTGFLRSLTYARTAGAPATGSRALTITLSDPGGHTAAATVTVDVTAAPTDPPIAGERPAPGASPNETLASTPGPPARFTAAMPPRPSTRLSTRVAAVPPADGTDDRPAPTARTTSARSPEQFWWWFIAHGAIKHHQNEQEDVPRAPADEARSRVVPWQAIVALLLGGGLVLLVVRDRRGRAQPASGAMPGGPTTRG